MQIPMLTKKQSTPQGSRKTACAMLTEGNFYSIPVEMITPNRYQPRKAFDSVSLLRLADSIKRYGVLQPITVRSNGDKLYEIICGERRYRAAIIAELSCIPCNVINTSDLDSAELSIIENLLRDDLNMFEQAESFNLLIATFSLTQEDVACRVSLSQSAVANKLRLLRYSPDERKMIIEFGLTERHARTLLRLPDSAARVRFIKLISKDKLNVAATEALVDNFLQYLADIPSKSSHSHSNTKGIVKDIRILTNTIENAAALLRKSGFSVETKSEETSGSYSVVITVYKQCFT